MEFDYENVTADLNYSSTTTVTTTDNNIFYYANKTPVTYSYFAINVVMICFHIGNIILNSFMIEAIRRSRKVEEPSGHCLIMLSAVYIWHGFMMIYTGVYGLVNMQVKMECLLRFGLTHSAFLLISWSNCVLTFDRFLQIEYPFWYKRNIHIKTIWIGNLLATTGSLFFCLSPLIFGWYVPQGNRRNFCEYFNVLPTAYFQIFFSVTFSGLPFFIVAYSKLLCTARRHKSALRKMSRQYSSSNVGIYAQSRNWKPVLMVLAICSIYLFCWAPPGVFGFILASAPESLKITYTNYLSTMATLIMFPSLSGIICPCMYVLNKEVKAKFLHLLRCRKHGSYPSSPSSKIISRRVAKAITTVGISLTSPENSTEHRNSSTSTSGSNINAMP